MIFILTMFEKCQEKLIVSDSTSIAIILYLKKNLCILVITLYIFFIASLDTAKSKFPKAMIKSDLSCTEDENFNGVPKYDLKRSASPKNKSKKVKLNSEFQYESSSSCPPQYNPIKSTYLSTIICHIFFQYLSKNCFYFRYY